MLRRLTISLAGLVLASGVAFGQGKLGPHVVDSNGQRVGYFAGTDASTGVSQAVVFIGGEAHLMFVARNGFLPTDVLLYNDDAACHGDQYLAFGSPTFNLLAPASHTTDGFYHYIAAADVELLFILGVQALHGDGTLGDCGPVGGNLYVAPHQIVQAPTFTPPFLVVDAFPVSPAPGTATFNDVPTTHPFFRFIEALHAAGITGGCSVSPPLYCPDDPVSRGQMAVFLAKALGL